MSSDKDRQRLHRERQAAGKIPVMVCIDEVGWTVALAEAGFLKVSAASDPTKLAIGEALSVVLDLVLHADLTQPSGWRDQVTGFIGRREFVMLLGDDCVAGAGGFEPLHFRIGILDRATTGRRFVRTGQCIAHYLKVEVAVMPMERGLWLPKCTRKEKAPAGAGRPGRAAWNSQLKSRRSVLTSIRKDARGLVPTSRVHALN